MLCEICNVGNVHFLPCVSNLYKNRMKAVFDQKLMVGWGEHKGVLDESGFSAYQVNLGLNFLSVAHDQHRRAAPRVAWTAP